MFLGSSKKWENGLLFVQSIERSGLIGEFKLRKDRLKLPSNAFGGSKMMKVKKVLGLHLYITNFWP